MDPLTEPDQAEHHVEWEQTACPLCGEEASTFVLSARDWQLGYPGDFQLNRCRGCSHVYLNPRPTPDCINVFYPREYGPYQAGAADDGPRSRDTKQVGLLRRLLRWSVDTCGEFVPEINTSPRRALEIGCANGDFLLRLNQQGWQVQGVEFSPPAAQRATERGLDVHLGTLESAQFAAEQFDAVFLWMVLEHVYDPRATLREIRRILKPGGWVIFSLPNFASWERHLCGRYWYALELPRHLHHFTVPVLQRLLHDSGFGSIRVIHQRNINSLVGSLGYWLQDKSPESKLARRLIAHCDDPSTWAVILLALSAKILAWLRQSGRLTVVARPQSESLELK